MIQIKDTKDSFNFVWLSAHCRQFAHSDDLYINQTQTTARLKERSLAKKCVSNEMTSSTRARSGEMTSWFIVLKVPIQLKENRLILIGSRFGTVVWVFAFP